MLIVDNKIAIVHMRKCGGTSFCRGLIDLLPQERVYFLGYTPQGEANSTKGRHAGSVWKHSPAREVARFVGKNVFDGMHVILLSERPYWQRVASFYEHAVRQNRQRPQDYVWAPKFTFSQHLRSSHAALETIPDFSRDDNGKIIVNEIVPFDQIGEAFKRLCTRLGLPDRQLPHLNANPHPPDYRALYSNEDWAFIEDHFRDERKFMAEWRSGAVKRGRYWPSSGFFERRFGRILKNPPAVRT